MYLIILESGFISHFGHLALLSYLKSGMALEILPKRELMLVASSRKLNDRPFLRMSLQGLQFADPLATESIFNLDRLFAMSEKTVMVSSKDGLLDMQELVNGVEELGGSNINQTLSSLVLESEETIFQQKLNPYYKLGYSWFATIHIRQSNGKDSSRNNSIVSLMEIVAYLNSSGGFAILVGEDSKNTLGKDGFDYLDLRAVSKEQRFLVDLAIMKSRYFIGPDSGPGAIAVLLGIPSLRLDGVAFLKNTYSTHGPSVSLPKFWVDTQNQKVPLNKVLDSNLGFCEDDKLISSYKMVNNSAQDALAGFKLLETISKSSNRAEAHMDEFSRQKIAAGGIGSGLISPDFYNK